MSNGVIERDLPEICEALNDFESYSFPAELRGRMALLSLSSAALGERTGVSHTIVDKWLKELALPNGRERMKKLGMSLGMNESELNRFLLRNGYPALFAKNPLDGVALRLLTAAAGRADIVTLYDELAEKLDITSFTPKSSYYSLRTSVMLSGLMKREDGELADWLRENQQNFTADARTIVPDRALSTFLRLYIGEESINSLCQTCELPAALGSLLYALQSGKPVRVRGLREKLIALGLFFNMTEEEIDMLLGFVRLRPVTSPSSRLDMAVLLALREGHMHYALYESDNLERALALMQKNGGYGRELEAEYRLRALGARERADYYNRIERSAEELEYEEYYTAYSDHGLMDYVRDILTCLAEKNALRQSELDDLISYITRPEEGETSWR